MYRRWTKEELEFLEDNYGLISFDEMCKKLNRTHDSIEAKRIRSNIGEFDNFYTFTSLGMDLGISHSTVKRYADLKMFKHSKTSYSHGNHVPVIITFDEAEKFVKNYWHLFKIDKVVNPVFKKIIIKNYCHDVKYYCNACRYYHYNNCNKFELHIKYKNEGVM